MEAIKMNKMKQKSCTGFLWQAHRFKIIKSTPAHLNFRPQSPRKGNRPLFSAHIRLVAMYVIYHLTKSEYQLRLKRKLLGKKTGESTDMLYPE